MRFMDLYVRIENLEIYNQNFFGTSTLKEACFLLHAEHKIFTSITIIIDIDTDIRNKLIECNSYWE